LATKIEWLNPTQYTHTQSPLNLTPLDYFLGIMLNHLSTPINKKQVNAWKLRLEGLLAKYGRKSCEKFMNIDDPDSGLYAPTVVATQPIYIINEQNVPP
jgi:hypothetical protein